MKLDPLQQKILAETKRYLRQAQPLMFGQGKLCPELDIFFDLRGRNAGQVRMLDGQPICIRYNLALAKAQPQEFIEQTVPHEVAHVVVAVCYGGVKPHGPQWQGVMRYLGIENPERCHQFDVSSVGQRLQKRWIYRCACREHELSTTRHNRVQNHRQSYVCRDCAAVLVWVKPA